MRFASFSQKALIFACVLGTLAGTSAHAGASCVDAVDASSWKIRNVWGSKSGAQVITFLHPDDAEYNFVTGLNDIGRLPRFYFVVAHCVAGKQLLAQIKSDRRDEFYTQRVGLVHRLSAAAEGIQGFELDLLASELNNKFEVPTTIEGIPDNACYCHTEGLS